MTLIRGTWGAVDDVGDPYQNNIEDIRAMLWDTYSQQQGVIRGFDMTLDSGSLSVTFSPGSAVIEERGVDGLGDERGYHVFNDQDTVVTFDTPDASARSDAVVFAWADPQYGTLGASVNGPGPQIVVVRGVSGSTTPRTDTEINDEIGPGGWFRFADVQIDPADTEIDPANVTLADVLLPNIASEWEDFTSLTFTASGTNPTYTVNTARFKQVGKTVHLFVDISISNKGSGIYSLQLGSDAPTPKIAGNHFLPVVFASSDSSHNIGIGWWNVQGGGSMGVPNPGTGSDWNSYNDTVLPTGFRVQGTYEAE